MLYEPRPPSQLRRNLRCSTLDGIAYCVMVGTGESYFPAFVLALGLGEVAAGLVATVPLVIGAAFQLISAAAVDRLHSYKVWIVLMAGLQAAGLLPLALAAAFHMAPGWLVFTMAALYWFSFLSGGAAWNTWIAMNVPTRIRARYFGWRNRVLQIATLAALLGGGFILRGAESISLSPPVPGWTHDFVHSIPVRTFGILFGIACVSRGISTYYLSRQSEPRPLPIVPRRVGAGDLARRMLHGPDGRLILYLVCMSIAAHIGQPFFNPFMIEKLKLDPDMYSLMLAAPLLGRALALPHCGLVAQKRGARFVLLLGGISLAPFSVNWLITDNFVFLFLTQLLSGAAWAAYELGLFLMLLDTTQPEERTSVVSQYQFVNSCAMVAGNALGALGLWWWHASWGAYAIIFIASLVARLLTIPLALRTRAGSPHAPLLEIETLAVRPSGSAVDAPIVATLEKPSTRAPR